MPLAPINTGLTYDCNLVFLFVVKIFYFAWRMIIGEVVKQLRQRKALTQEEVCRIANITQGFYSSIENNSATPSLETLTRLSKVFDLPVFLLIWMATEKHTIPRHHKKWYNALKPILDNIIEEVITQNESKIS